VSKTAIPTIASDGPTGAYCEETIIYAQTIMVRARLGDAGALYPTGYASDAYCARLILANLRAWRRTLPKADRATKTTATAGEGDQPIRRLAAWIISDACTADQTAGISRGVYLRAAEATCRVLIGRLKALEAARTAATPREARGVGVGGPVPSVTVSRAATDDKNDPRKDWNQ
jgi:hypothetical protein